METIPLSECTKIGFLQKPHGVAGEIVLSFDETYEDDIRSAEILFIKIDGLLVPFFVLDEGTTIVTPNRAYIQFRWIDSAEKAREFCGHEVYLKTIELKNMNKTQDLSLLVGFTVLDDLKKQIGQISEVNDYNGNIVLSVIYSGKEVLIPFHPEIVGIFDNERKIVQISIPDGLLNLDEI